MGLNAAGIMSSACVNNVNRCSAGERVFDTAAAVLVLLLMALIIARGWKGRLFGARKHASRSDRAWGGRAPPSLLHRIVGGVSRLPDRIALPASS